MPPSQTDDDAPRYDFDEVARDVFPAGTSARLARALDVHQRMAQRWLSGDMQPTPEAVAFVEDQDAALRNRNPTHDLNRLAEEWSTAGLHNEVIASHLADMFERLLGRKID